MIFTSNFEEISEEILEASDGLSFLLPLLLATLISLVLSMAEDDIGTIRGIFLFAINAVVLYVNSFCYWGIVIYLFPVRLMIPIFAIDVVAILLNYLLVYPMFILSQIRKIVNRLYNCVVKKHQ